MKLEVVVIMQLQFPKLAHAALLLSLEDLVKLQTSEQNTHSVNSLFMKRHTLSVLALCLLDSPPRATQSVN